MEYRLSDRILLMKIKLAFATEKLGQLGQNNLSSYVYNYVTQLFNELDEMKYSTEPDEVENRMQSVLNYLGEIENVLLTFKVGVAAHFDESTLTAVRDVKNEIKELIRRKAYSLNY
jgi:hypothetical protein